MLPESPPFRVANPTTRPAPMLAAEGVVMKAVPARTAVARATPGAAGCITSAALGATPHTPLPGSFFSSRAQSERKCAPGGEMGRQGWLLYGGL